MNRANNAPHLASKNTARCTRVSPDLKAYADQELPLTRRFAVRTHLARCPDCRRELHALKEIAMTLQQDETTRPLSPNLRDRLLTTWKENPSPSPTTAPVPLWQRSPLLTFGAGGGLLAASAAAWISLYNGANPQSSTVAASRNSLGVTSIRNAPDYDENVPAVSAGAVPIAPPILESSAAKSDTLSDAAVTRSVKGNNNVAPVYRGSPRGGRYAPTRLAQARVPDASIDAEIKRIAIGGEVHLMQHGNTRDKTTEYNKAVVNGNITGAELDRLPALVEERKVHREASIGVAVERLEATSDKVEEMTRAAGGFVASNNLQTDEDGYKSAALSIRVPVEKFDQTLADLAKLGDVVSKSVTGEDVTERVSDATSDEQILVDETRKVEERLKQEGLSEKRTTLKEAELRQVRMQLARTRARLGLLRRMASLSTIEVSLTQKAKKSAQVVPPKPGFWTDLHDTNRAASLAFQAAIRVPIVLFVWALAFSPLWVPLIFALRYLSLKNAAEIAAVNTQSKPESN